MQERRVHYQESGKMVEEVHSQVSQSNPWIMEIHRVAKGSFIPMMRFCITQEKKVRLRVSVWIR